MQVARYQNPFSPNDSDSDLRRDTDLEILFMNVQGTCTPGNFPIIIHQDPARRSLGTLEEETANDPDFVPADALLNVYGLIVDVTVGRELHTDSAVSMQCLGITAVPVTGCTFTFVGSLAGQPGGQAAGAPPPVDLFDETETNVGSLTNASITPLSVDSDADGCSDTAEQQTANGTQSTGGRRNYQNFWDFADVPDGNGLRDGKVTVVDILGVVYRYNANDSGATGGTNRFSNPLDRPDPAPAYHSAFDRTFAGPNAWNLGPPDGQISVSDILNVAKQYGHHCP
jgi:hypothetical protein